MKLTDLYRNPPERDRQIEQLMERHAVPGLCMTVLSGGAIAGTHCYGLADSDSGAPITPGTVFEAASLTKTMFACMVLRRVDAGRLALDAPVAPLIPALQLSDDPRIATVTPRHILSHGTGLPNWAAKPLAFAFDPGRGFGYSGEGFYFLQRALEQVEGSDFPQMLERELLAPWGMAHSSGVWHAGLGMARTFTAEGNMRPPKTEVDKTGNAPEPNAAWSLCTTTSEYAAFLVRLLSERGGLAQETFDAMLSPQNQADEHICWGLGWGLVRAAPGVFWHWGSNTGYKSLTVTDRSTGDGLVLFTNSDNGGPFTRELAPLLTDGDFYSAMDKFIRAAE